MSPSGGAITLVDQPITWSPLNRMPAVGQREAQMVRGVARRVHRLEAPARRRRSDRRRAPSISGDEIPVAALLDRRVAAPAAGMRAEAVGRGAGRRLAARAAAGEWSRWVWVTRICVTCSPREAGQQRLDMLVEIRAGIDHRDLAVADDIGAGAAEGERAGIARDDAADHRRDRRAGRIRTMSRRKGISTAMSPIWVPGQAPP